VYREEVPTVKLIPLTTRRNVAAHSEYRPSCTYSNMSAPQFATVFPSKQNVDGGTAPLLITAV
jgi:hypothetical protein